LAQKQLEELNADETHQPGTNGMIRQNLVKDESWRQTAKK